MNPNSLPTPFSLNYRMPAEWEPHEATWIGWPHNITDWPGKFAPIPWVYGEIVRKLIEGEKVRILVDSAEQETKARRVLKKVGADSKQVEFFSIPTNRGWTRDFGPTFVKKNSSHPAKTRPDPNPLPAGEGIPGGAGTNSIAAVRFYFSAWAKYPDWPLDNQAPEKIIQALGCPAFDAQWKGRCVVLEGGSIDGNGLGSMLTTEECLLDPEIQVRNPGFTREDYHDIMKHYLGVENVIWLGKGIAGDDTHGHIDDLCRFVNPRTVVLCREDDPRDANYRPLCENAERLESARLENGQTLDVISLPLPKPVIFDGQRVPASYANFLIANAYVLVPTFNDPSDRLALGVLAECFPDRRVAGIHAIDLVWGLGTVHCLTQQQPIG